MTFQYVVLSVRKLQVQHKRCKVTGGASRITPGYGRAGRKSGWRANKSKRLISEVSTEDSK